MVGKANDIYTRWSRGQDVPTIVLRHADDYLDAQMPLLTDTTDTFASCHHSLPQCIAEAHERAKLLFPTRKPCTCSSRALAADPCPPSHSWAPPPQINTNKPVLPELYLSNYSRALVVCGGSPVPPLSPTSKFAVVDTLNFELGALNPGSDQSWMAWF